MESQTGGSYQAQSCVVHRSLGGRSRNSWDLLDLCISRMLHKNAKALHSIGVQRLYSGLGFSLNAADPSLSPGPPYGPPVPTKSDS